MSDQRKAPSFSTILYRTADQVATITLNRPDELNTIVPPMPDELAAAIGRAIRDPEVKVIVLRGALEFTSGEVIHLIVSAGMVSALLRFALLERRAYG